MAKEYKCPACKNDVDRGAVICSNPECRKSLAFCSYCRDVTTYVLVEKAEARSDATSTAVTAASSSACAA